MAHSGFSSNKQNTEDVIYSLSEVKGIDAITFSHTHKVFPAKTEAALDGLFLGADKSLFLALIMQKEQSTAFPLFKQVTAEDHLA